MRDVAEHVREWVQAGVGATVAWPVRLQGFGGCRAEGVVARSGAGEVVGSLLNGSLVEALASARPGLVDLAVADADAERRGLACGGVATVLVQPAGAVPVAVWDALAHGRPVAVAVDTASGATLAVVDGEAVGTLSDPQVDADVVARARDALRQARPGPRSIVVGERSFALLVFVAPTRVVVVGAVDLAAAIEEQGRLLGWTVVTVATAGQAEAAVAGLRAADAVVVLSHDDTVDAPSLRAALAGPAGFVGALGSRHTQARRAEDLRRAGVAEADVERIHGPVGLDLGGTTPQDTALAICAEILAARSGRSATTLQGRAAPIH